jgi:predicted metal-dependent phosphoesterase TrpH
LSFNIPTTGREIDRARLDALRALVDAGNADESAIDLHSHSRHSDGDWTPPELIADASRLGLRLLSLTDHDTVSGQAAARLAAAEHGLIYLTGMEVSLTFQDRLFHVLAYDFDSDAPVWARFAELRRARRDRFALALFEQLAAKGYAVSPDLARDESGHFVAEPLGVALAAAGKTSSPEAGHSLARNLGLRFPVETDYLALDEFAALVGPRDGVFSVAHPARQQSGVSDRLTEDDLVTLKAALPLVALEAYHPYHAPADVEHYARLAAQHGLAVTCGSDAHGLRHGRPLRRHPASLAADFLRIIQGRWEARIPLAAPG